MFCAYYAYSCCMMSHYLDFDFTLSLYLAFPRRMVGKKGFKVPALACLACFPLSMNMAQHNRFLNVFSFSIVLWTS